MKINRKSLTQTLLLSIFIFSSASGWALEPEEINVPLVKKWAKITSIIAVGTVGASYYYKKEADNDFNRSENLRKSQFDRDESYQSYLTNKSASHTLGYFAAATFILSGTLWYKCHTISQKSAAEEKRPIWSVDINDNGNIIVALSQSF